MPGALQRRAATIPAIEPPDIRVRFRLMQRIAVSVAAFAVLIAACGGDDGASATATLHTTGAPTTILDTVAPSTTAAFVPEVITDRLEVDGLRLTGIPRLWRIVTAPPEGAQAAVYAPSDNNMVAERLLLKAVPLDPTAAGAEHVEDASNELEDHFVDVVVLGTAQATIGPDRVPAQQIRFTWEQPREAGLGWRWVVATDTTLVFITYLADLSEPGLYIDVVQELLDTADVRR